MRGHGSVTAFGKKHVAWWLSECLQDRTGNRNAAVIRV